MRTLNRKVLRDLAQLLPQLVAIGLVIGCGVAMMVLAWSTLASLQLTQEAYYERYRFGHVFAHLKRAPQALERRLASIPGVARLQTRVVHDATLDLPGSDEPLIGRLISLDAGVRTGLNLLHLRQGRFPRHRQADEVLVSEGFANAHGLRPGDHLDALLNGRRQRLNLVGIALSPEYIYQIRPGEIMPNDRSFAILWMGREELAAAFNMEGAFNDVVISLSPRGQVSEVIDQLDRLLGDYGGIGAYGRELQTSHRYVTNELRELRNMGLFAPVIFLAVAAFLLNVVLSRIIGAQREQIATLKAFGYTPREIGEHYLKMAALVTLVGIALGVAGGRVLGVGLTRMYANFFRFPVLEFRLHPLVVLMASVVSLVAAFLGVALAVRRAVKLPPAAAMQPEPPSRYRPALLERRGVLARMSPRMRMILRHLESRPLTTLLTILGIALAVGVLVLGNHSVDAVDTLLDFHFFAVQRQNVWVTFTEPTSSRALHELQRLPGVRLLEPVRGVAARLRVRSRARLQDILGLPGDPQLFRLLDQRRQAHPLPPAGLVLSVKLAELLEVRVGEWVEVEVLEGQRPTRRIPVVGVIDDLIGTSAYMRLEALQRLLHEGDAVSGALLAVDEQHLADVFRHLKQTPRVASVTAKLTTLRSFRETLVGTIMRMRAINLLFATIIAFGVVYNSARITVAERARDLASLRVLGYTRGEISFILLGELGLVTVLAIPLGMVVGYGLVVLTTWGYDTELFRIPVVIYRSTYALAGVAVLIASLGSALVVRRRLDRLDLVAVLKAKE